MPQLRPSPLIRLPDTLIESHSAIPVTLPSRLALNHALKNELSICTEWFYDRTFPLWAAGRVDGLIFNSTVSPGPDTDSPWHTLMVGAIAADNQQDVELQLVGANIAQSTAEYNACYPLNHAVAETVVSEFCHLLGIPTARVLCVISNNHRKGIADYPCILLSRAAQSYISHQHIIGAFAFDPALGQTLVDFIRDHYFVRAFPLSAEQLYAELCIQSLDTVARWQIGGLYCDRLGSHKLYIGGQTMDLGNTGFVETVGGDISLFSGTSVNHQDFRQQPQIAIQLCLTLGHAMAPMFTEEWRPDAFTESLRDYYELSYYREFSRKLLLSPQGDNRSIIDDLLELMTESASNYYEVIHGITTGFKRPDFARLNIDNPGLNTWFSDYQQHRAICEQGNPGASSKTPFNPERALQERDISAIVAAIEDGNRNALENFLESVQNRKPFSVLHWAS